MGTFRVSVFFSFLVVCVFLSHAQQTSRASFSQSNTETVLSGGDWKLGSFEMDNGEKQGAFLSDFDDHAFRTVQVPGEVQLQIGLHGMDLYYQSKSLSLINQKEWWYRKQFSVGKNDAGRLLRLRFDGVDYFASVWLNGEKLGDHEGGYVPFSYDVTRKVRYGKPNLLAVKVTCPWVPKEGRGFLEYMKGDWTTIDPENQVHINKPPFFLGPYWDGIPADGNAAFPMGLWRDVRLLSSGSSVIDDLFVSTKSLNEDGSATLAISATIRNYGAGDANSVLKLQITPENFKGGPLALPDQRLALHPGENEIALEANVKNPKLWWTWDLGDQNLYKVVGSFVSLDREGLSDRRETVFGIRTITLKDDMSYWLNGRRLFLKGAWYPMSDYYGSKPTRERFEQDLLLFRAANLNHLVAFTVVEKPDFYDLCDRLGILEIFEFPLNQDGPVDVLSYSNPRRETFVRESLSQVRQIILELRSHPSIIEWAAFAEAHAKGGGWGVGSWDFEQYGYGAYSEAIGKSVADLAPGTIYNPSLCDLGEQHFWMGNAGMGNTDSYNQHFQAQTGFVSEYGSLSLPVLESWKKELAADAMWSQKNDSLPRWHNLPINISAYSYLSSFDYDGVASVLDRVNQYVDRHIKSVQELVGDSQLYQAFLMKYATDAYRRKKYAPVNGTRFWDYGEVWPGIRWGIIDYFRVPKMSYYAIKQAQARLAINFAYEDALESQPSGEKLHIPVWLINDYAEPVNAKIHCELLDLSGHVVWSGDYDAQIPADQKKEVGVVDFTTPDAPGVYVLRGRVMSGENPRQAEASTFIKVTPKLFSRELKVLLIGQKKYSVPIRELVRSTGTYVDVIDEDSISRFHELQDSEQLKNKYDVVWLAAFDSLWKLMDPADADGLSRAIHSGIGFIHSGGRASFHGGFGEGACLDFTSLADVLPVEVQDRYDLVLGEADERTNFFSQFAPLKEIRVTKDNSDWGDGGLKAFGVPGFNETKLKPDAKEIMTVSDRPLLVVGQYGNGRTAVFTGFTPAYSQEHAYWDSKITYPYLVDQELYKYPVTRAYLYLFMEMLAKASGQTPKVSYEEFVTAREKPLFESLKDLPGANVKVFVNGGSPSAEHPTFSIEVRNGDHYARLVRVRAEWEGEGDSDADLVLYDDNYFDLVPGERRVIQATVPLVAHGRHLSGTLQIEGSNVKAMDVAIELPGLK